MWLHALKFLRGELAADASRIAMQGQARAVCGQGLLVAKPQRVSVLGEALDPPRVAPWDCVAPTAASMHGRARAVRRL